MKETSLYSLWVATVLISCSVAAFSVETPAQVDLCSVIENAVRFKGTTVWTKGKWTYVPHAGVLLPQRHCSTPTQANQTFLLFESDDVPNRDALMKLISSGSTGTVEVIGEFSGEGSYGPNNCCRYQIRVSEIKSVRSGSPASQDSEELSVVVEDASISLAKGLAVRWSIKNTSSHPIQIYSSFLQGPVAGAEFNENGTLVVFTSITDKLKGKPYAYPDATFTVLEPNGTANGVLRDATFARRHAEELRQKPMKLVLRISSGPVQDLNEELSRAYRSETEHPANPIVSWQQLEYSQPVKLR